MLFGGAHGSSNQSDSFRGALQVRTSKLPSLSRTASALAAAIVVSVSSVVAATGNGLASASAPSSVLAYALGPNESVILSSGDQVQTQERTNWQWAPGQSAFQVAIAQDGTALVADEQQNDNPFAEPTGLGETVSAVSNGSVSGVPGASGKSFSNIPIPLISVSSGHSVAGSTLNPPGPGSISGIAADGAGAFFVSDLQYSPLPGTSGPSWTADGNGGVFPTLGKLSEAGGSWSYSAGYSANQIAASNPSAGSLACPADQVVYTQGSPGWGVINECRTPSSVATLPTSGDLVVTQYTAAACSRIGDCGLVGSPAAASDSGGLMILGPDGKLVTSWEYPAVVKGVDGNPICIQPRYAAADPSSPTGTDRFAIVSDVYEDPTPSAGPMAGQSPNGCLDSETVSSSSYEPFVVQEFQLSASASSGSTGWESANLSPISPLTISGDEYSLASGGLSNFMSAQAVQYDSHGDLWVAQAYPPTMASGNIDEWKADVNGELSAGCSRQVGSISVCSPTSEVNPNVPVGAGGICGGQVIDGAPNLAQVTSLDTLANVSPTSPLVRNGNLGSPDPSAGMVAVSQTGCVVLVEPAHGGGFVESAPSSLQARQVASADLLSCLMIRQGDVDSQGDLWVPLQQMTPKTSPSQACPGPAGGPGTIGQTLPQWLFDVQLGALQS